MRTEPIGKEKQHHLTPQKKLNIHMQQKNHIYMQQETKTFFILFRVLFKKTILQFLFGGQNIIY